MVNSSDHDPRPDQLRVTTFAQVAREVQVATALGKSPTRFRYYAKGPLSVQEAQLIGSLHIEISFARKRADLRAPFTVASGTEKEGWKSHDEVMRDAFIDEGAVGHSHRARKLGDAGLMSYQDLVVSAVRLRAGSPELQLLISENRVGLYGLEKAVDPQAIEDIFKLASEKHPALQRNPANAEEFEYFKFGMQHFYSLLSGAGITVTIRSASVREGDAYRAILNEWNSY